MECPLVKELQATRLQLLHALGVRYNCVQRCVYLPTGARSCRHPALSPCCRHDAAISLEAALLNLP